MLETKIKFENKNSFWKHVKQNYLDDMDSRSIYLALTVYFWMQICVVGIPLRIPMLICAFLEKRKHRVAVYMVLLGSCAIFYGIMSYDMLLYGVALIIGAFIIEYKKTRNKSYYNSLLLLLFSMTALMIIDVSQNYLLDGLMRTYTRNAYYLSSVFRVFGIFLIIELIRILNVFINNLKISSLVIFNSYFLLGAIHFWTMSITNKEFTLPDLYLAKTVAGVISNVQIEPSEIGMFLIYILLIVIFNVVLVKTKWNKDTLKERSFHALYAACSFFLIVTLLQSDWATDDTYAAVKRRGLAANLVATARGIEEPSGFEAYMNVIESNHKEIKTSQAEENISSKPNIIVIMSEAFSDLQMVADFETNEDYMPYTRELLKKHPSGTLYSSVYGNNTCSSEYEFLTGVSTGFATTGGSIYQTYMKEGTESIVSLLESQGYHTTGIHDYNGAGYNRRYAWECFGFDTILFEEDFDKDVRRIRDYISDEAFYEKIIEEFEKNKDNGPEFTFGISMQNHGTYGTEYEGDIKLSNMEYDNVEEYLSLIKETDKANQKLIDYFSQVEEDTMIVFFGDHQPIIDSDFYTEIMGTDFYELAGEEKALTYQIPYFVWTNYELTADVPEKASINYLPNIILDAAGLQKDAWFSFTDQVFEKFPIVTDQFSLINGEYIDKETILKSLNKIKAPDEDNSLELLKKYQVWSYKKALEKGE